MRRFALIAAALVAGLALAAAGCGGGSGASATTSSTTTATTTGPLAAGKAVFLGDSGCGGCHTLADAGAGGTVASNLDEKKPTAAHVQDVVTNGTGAMPAYGKQLTPQQVADVAAYVAWAAGR